MDVQFYGANCLVFSNKELRIVVDDNLAKLGAKSVQKDGDVVLYTGEHDQPTAQPKIMIDRPGEYEIANVSITGVAAQSHLSEKNTPAMSTIYKIAVGDTTYVVLGHLQPNLLDEDQLETLGMVDVLFVPVGGHGYTLDPVGALKLTRHIDPKLVIPTHYADKDLKYDVPQESLETALKEFAMEPKERTEKLRLKPLELSEVTQLIVLERS